MALINFKRKKKCGTKKNNEIQEQSIRGSIDQILILIDLIDCI